jgi:hypothetical protein
MNTSNRQEMDTLLNNLDAIDAATDNEQRRRRIEKALNHLKPLQNQGKHAPFEPNLPLECRLERIIASLPPVRLHHLPNSWLG